MLEKAHAEVRTRVALDVCAGRSDDDAVETRDRSGRFEAIGTATNWRVRVGERDWRG